MGEKPPIGVSPHWFVYNQRMTELSEAIGRYIHYAQARNGIERIQSYDIIAEWCEELKTLALLEARLEREHIG